MLQFYKCFYVYYQVLDKLKKISQTNQQISRCDQSMKEFTHENEFTNFPTYENYKLEAPLSIPPD